MICGDGHTRGGNAARMLKGPRRLGVDDERECLRDAIEAVFIGDEQLVRRFDLRDL